MRNLTSRIAESERLPVSCRCCLTRPVDVFNEEASFYFCRRCDELIERREIRAHLDDDVVVYEPQTAAARRWVEAGHRRYDESLSK